VADPYYGNQLYESTKTNNLSAGLAITALPDIAPVSLSAPTGIAGRAVQLVLVATNQGAGSASGYWYDGIYLSTNAVLATNAVPLTYVYQNHSVGAGSNYVWTNSVSLPAAAVGNYYLIVHLADPYYGNQLQESIATNNISSALSLAPLTPDLVAGVAGQIGSSSPMLSITEAGKNMILSWPASATGYSLQSNTNLALASAWNAMTNIPAVVGNQCYVTDSIVGVSKFYRLLNASGSAQSNVGGLRFEPVDGSGVGSWVAAAGPYPASAHPYTNGSASYVTLAWTNTYPGADGLQVSFDPQTQFGKNDSFSVLDGSGTAVSGSPFTYGQLAGQTVYVPGDRVILQLSEYPQGEGSWGFAVTNVQTGTLSGPLTITAAKPNPVVLVQWSGVNGGAGPVSSSWYDFVYYATNAGMTNEQTLTDASQPGPLAAGAGYQQSVRVTLPLTASGTNYYQVMLDAYNYIFESNKSNNLSAVVPVVFNLVPPDLQAAGLRVMPLDGSGVGNWASQSGPFPASIHPYTNNMSAYWTNSYPGADALRVSFDPQTAGEEVYDQLHIEDGSGADIAGSPFSLGTLAGQTVTVPGDTLILHFTSDADVTGWGFAVTGVQAGTLTNGATVTGPALNPVVLVQWHGYNGGPGAVPTNSPGYWYDFVYYATNAAMTNEQNIGSSAEYAPLVAGAGYEQSMHLTLPMTASGTGYVDWMADAYNYIYENNKTNNTSVSVPVAFNLVPPDLLPVSVSAPLGVSGSSVTIVTVVTNQGAGGALGTWYDGIYLSTNAVLASNAVPTTYAYQSRTVPAGGLYAWTNTVSLPPLNGATYYLFVRVADPYYGNQLYESTKTNNTSAGLALTSSSPSSTSNSVTGIVSPAAPLLNIAQAGTNVVFSWSTNATGYYLQSKTNLASTSAWSTVTNIPVMIGDQFYVTNAIVGPSQYYRLRN
jgi:hypothetical protein